MRMSDHHGGNRFLDRPGPLADGIAHVVVVIAFVTKQENSMAKVRTAGICVHRREQYRDADLFLV